MIVGAFRQDISSSLGSIPNVLAGFFNNYLIWDTASYAYHQSQAFVRLSAVIGGQERLYLVQQWFLGIFGGGSLFPDSALTAYAQKFFPGMGGGFFPFYFWFYFGIPGLVFSGIAVAAIFRFVGDLDASNGDVAFMLGLACFSTVGRWYIYSPTPLTRGLLLMALVGECACLISRANSMSIGSKRHICTGELYTLEINRTGSINDGSGANDDLKHSSAKFTRRNRKSYV